MHYALISFLNARPLWWGLVHGISRDEESYEFTSPARCADLLAEGHAGLGLIPAIEMARIPGLVAAPSLCIASRTEVRSVLLFSRVRFEEIRSVALDPSSRTSVCLARILLAERLGLERYRGIRFDAVESRHLLTLEGHDAVVVIGDPALQLSQRLGRGGLGGERNVHRYDLVSEWHDLFKEPFVFAVWAGRRDLLETVGAAELEARLMDSYEYGRAHLDEISRKASEELGLPYQELMDYFHHALHYQFGEGERRALNRFYGLAAKYGLIEEDRQIEWLKGRTPDRVNESTKS